MRVVAAGVLIGMLLVLLLVLNHSSSPHPRPFLQQRSPKPAPAKHGSIQDARDWHDPKLVVRPEGVEIIGITSAGQAIPVESVLEKLEQLPDSAWPYGLIVMVADSSILSSPGDIPQLQGIRSKLLKVLDAHGVAVDPRPA